MLAKCCPKQVGQKGCIPLPVHYFFCLFNKNVKTLQEQAVFHLLTECMDGLFHKITERCIRFEAIKQLKKCFNFDIPNNA